MRTLFAGSRQLLELRLFVGHETGGHDAGQLVADGLRFDQQGFECGLLGGVELPFDHEVQVLFDGAESLVGGGEADVRRLWRSVAVGGGSGGFGHRFPCKASLWHLPGYCRYGWDGAGGPNGGRTTRAGITVRGLAEMAVLR